MVCYVHMFHFAIVSATMNTTVTLTHSYTHPPASQEAINSCSPPYDHHKTFDFTLQNKRIEKKHTHNKLNSMEIH